MPEFDYRPTLKNIDTFAEEAAANPKHHDTIEFQAKAQIDAFLAEVATSFFGMPDERERYKRELLSDLQKRSDGASEAAKGVYRAAIRRLGY